MSNLQGAGYKETHPLEVSDKDFYLDLLFYHLKLRCFIVIDLKKGDFKPEYAGTTLIRPPSA